MHIFLQNGEINDHVKEHDYYSIERKKVKAELTRTLTEIRKSYIRRVCSTVRRKNKEADESLYLFECCLLVELNMSTLTPFVKGKYPSNVSRKICFLAQTLTGIL